MKNLSCFTSLFVTLCASLNAAIVIKESFNYATGTLGTTTSTATGMTGSFGSFAFNGNIGGTANGVVTSGSLTAPTDYSVAPSNNHLSHTATGSNVSNSVIKLDVGAQINFDSTGTYYLSWLESHTASGFAFNHGSPIQLRNNSNNNLLQMGFFGGNLIATGSSTATGSALSSNQDRLLVFKIETSSSGNDVISGAFFNAGTTIGSEPVSWDLTLSNSITGTATFLNFVLGANAGPGVTHTTKVDELRLGTSFNDVTGVPEPSTYVLLAGIGAIAFCITRRRRS